MPGQPLRGPSSLVGAAEHGERQVKQGGGNEQPGPLKAVIKREIQADQSDDEQEERAEDALRVAPGTVAADGHDAILHSLISPRPAAAADF